MKCPFCSHTVNRVIDSRLSKEGEAIRRRRECGACGKRFTSYERVEEVLPLVVKSDGRRETFDRLKVVEGIRHACEKRPVSLTAIEQVVDDIEKQLQETGEKEVPSRLIGEEVLVRLAAIDDVAYIRYASVFRDFSDLSEFAKELNELIDRRTQETAASNG
ncbi:MAG: transcriptional regulator NrdR [Myxococcales bacterium]|nr:transcriptional regulator NrdR [Myxococcales bacterium]